MQEPLKTVSNWSRHKKMKFPVYKDYTQHVFHFQNNILSSSKIFLQRNSNLKLMFRLQEGLKKDSQWQNSMKQDDR